MGCQAGRFVMGIESNGDVKGCPSLQTAHYVGGNLRRTGLKDVWDTVPQLHFTRTRTVEDLWGFCRSCAFATPCMGGCSFTAHAVMGRPGNNPYCHFGARSLAREGRRDAWCAWRLRPERLLTTAALGLWRNRWTRRRRRWRARSTGCA